MKSSGSSLANLALIVALVFALIAGFYLVPGVYHPFSSDTVTHTTPHLTLSAVFGALAIVTLVLGQLARPKDRR
jgi:hypothetical protein